MDLDEEELKATRRLNGADRVEKELMTEEEKKAIEQLLWYKKLFDKGYCEDCNELCSSGASIPSKDLSKQIEVILNLIQKQQEKIKKLKDKNKDLLKKLRNRVREVKKLTKYSMYKKEFSTLNTKLKKKDEIIDLMNNLIYEVATSTPGTTFYYLRKMGFDDSKCKECNIENCKECIKQYFEKKVEDK